MLSTFAAASLLVLTAGPPSRTHDITVEDYFTLAVAGEAVIAPDGRFVAYTDARWDEALDGRNTDLWVVSTEAQGGSHPRRRLTFDDAADESPAWSADGRWVYFTSSRKAGDGDKPPFNGKAQVWRVPAEGGPEAPVTREKEGIDAFEISRDGRTLYYTVGHEVVEEGPFKELREKFDTVTYGHGTVTTSQLWKLDLESWRAEKLIDSKRVVVEFAVSPDQNRIAMIRRPDDTLLSGEGWSTVDVWDASTGTISTLPDAMWRQQAPSPYGWLVAPCWSDESTALAFRVDFDGYPGEIFVARYTGQGAPDLLKVHRPGEVSADGSMRWRPGTGELCFIAEDHARARVYAIAGLDEGPQGKVMVLTPGDVSVEGFSFTADGERMSLVMSGLDHPGDLFLVEPRRPSRTTRLTNVNPQVDTWKLPSIRIVQWTAPDGTTVEGILELPPGYEPGPRSAPLPMVVEIHGGPTSSTRYQFQYWIYGRTLFAARGWALLSPNYRGSTGYGDKFLTDLIGRENEIEVTDILAGVDAMVDRGIADASRLAVTGWSNGGYLTNCLIAHDDRFKAASSGAGVLDMAMQWGTEDTPGHVINYARGQPWTVPDQMQRMSPIYDAHKIHTPTVIHVGEKDERVPAAHSRALHRALYRYLNVPCELIEYPGAGHGLTKYSHRKAKLEWDLKWFDTYVLESAK